MEIQYKTNTAFDVNNYFQFMFWRLFIGTQPPQKILTTEGVVH